eukprot:5450750-Pyramimonas_sp.AAC.1
MTVLEEILGDAARTLSERAERLSQRAPKWLKRAPAEFRDVPGLWVKVLVDASWGLFGGLSGASG